MGDNPLHRITSLRYRLITGRVSLVALRVLAERTIEVGGWRVGVFALGASHAVRMERGDALITEFLTCGPPQGGDVILLDELGYQEGSFEAVMGGFRGCIRLTPFALNEGDDLDGAFAPTARLDIAYPALPRSVAPFTRVGWRLKEGGFDIETVHTYPEDGRGVRTHSHFRLEDHR